VHDTVKAKQKKKKKKKKDKTEGGGNELWPMYETFTYSEAAIKSFSVTALRRRAALPNRQASDKATTR
jgi:hypothetical protein